MIGGWVGEAFFVVFFPLSTLSDCVFVSLAVAPFVAGIKACREPQDLIGNLGEKKEKKKHWLLRCCIDVFEHRTLIFMPSKHTLKWFFNKCYTLMHSLSVQAIIMAFLFRSLSLSVCVCRPFRFPSPPFSFCSTSSSSVSLSSLFLFHPVLSLSTSCSSPTVISHHVTSPLSSIELYLTCSCKSFFYIASGETYTMDIKFNEQRRQITVVLPSIILFDWVLNCKIDVSLPPVHL